MGLTLFLKSDNTIWAKSAKDLDTGLFLTGTATLTATVFYKGNPVANATDVPMSYVKSPGVFKCRIPSSVNFVRGEFYEVELTIVLAGGAKTTIRRKAQADWYSGLST